MALRRAGRQPGAGREAAGAAGGVAGEDGCSVRREQVWKWWGVGQFLGQSRSGNVFLECSIPFGGGAAVWISVVQERTVDEKETIRCH